MIILEYQKGTTKKYNGSKHFVRCQY